MNVNNVKSSVGYSNNSIMNDFQDRKNIAQKYSSNNSSKVSPNGDTIDISKEARRAPYTNGIGLAIDKGTAANTTLYVDRGTLEKILSYSTNNPDCQWSEMGVDDEKRWVVVNGQRFECPLSKEEKELRRKLREESNLASILAKREKELDEQRMKKDEKKTVKLSFNGSNEMKFDGIENFQSNSKLAGLVKNEKVMTMLSNIAASSGGSINLSF